MRVLRLLKKNESKLFGVLSKFGKVWAPALKGESCVYSRMENSQMLCLSKYINCNRTLLPVKKFLMPPEFNMLSFTPEKFNKAELKIPTRVVVGIHPCEIHGSRGSKGLYSRP